MTLEDFERRIKNEKLEKVYDSNSWKNYIGLITRTDAGVENAYGIAKIPKADKYAIFFTNDERGGNCYYWKTFDDIEHACDKLYWYITLCDKAYKEKSIETNNLTKVVK